MIFCELSLQILPGRKAMHIQNAICQLDREAKTLSHE